MSLFIANHFSYIIRKDIKLCKKFDCVAIEFYKESTNMNKNLMLRSIYRTPSPPLQCLGLYIDLQVLLCNYLMTK